MVQAEDNAFVVFLANVDISAKMSYILFSMFRDLLNEIKMILATVLKHIDLYPFAHFLVFYRVFVIFFIFLLQGLNLLIALGFSKVW